MIGLEPLQVDVKDVLTFVRVESNHLVLKDRNLVETLSDVVSCSVGGSTDQDFRGIFKVFHPVCNYCGDNQSFTATGRALNN